MPKPLGENSHTPPNFNWDHVRIFLAIARTGRLTAAAARLATDHTTVSRKIAALEHDLKTTLFDRSPRGYTLNAQGQKLLAFAERMETLTEQAKDEIGGVDDAVSGTVRIGTPEGFGSYFLAERLGRLIDQHPKLHVQLVAGPNVFSLSKREADIVIGLSRPKGGRLFARKLADFELGLFGSNAYLSKHFAITNRADLKGHRFIGYISDLLYARELDYIQDVHPDAEAAIESSNLVAQLRTTATGGGLCILPAFIANTRPDLVPVLPEDIRLQRSFWLVHHEDMRSMQRIKVVVQFLVEEIKAARDVFQLPGAS